MEIPINYLNDYAVNLAETLTEKSKTDFFKEVHAQYYSNYDISFMDFFLDIIKKDGEFCIEHTKLIEYGVLTSTRSSNVKDKLEAHGLKEGVNFILLDVQQNENTVGRKPKMYYLTPNAFKICLMCTQKRATQETHSIVYVWYFLLLEKVHEYYSVYQLLYANKMKQILANKNKTLVSKLDEMSIENKLIIKQNEEQSEKIAELLSTTRTIVNQNVELKTTLIRIENELISISSKMDTLLNLYINDGNGYMIFQKIINEHDGNFSQKATQVEKLLCPGIARLKALFLSAFFKDGEIHIYSIARNLGYSLQERLNELDKRYNGWSKLFPHCVSLIYTEVNIELTFLESNSFWETGQYDKTKKCYVINYDINMTRPNVITLIRDGFTRATHAKINNYQKNVYDYDISNHHDEIIINTLKSKDNVFHNEARGLLTNITKSIVLKKTERIARDDIEYNGRAGIKLSDKFYYLTKLYQFIKSQSSLELIEEFKNNT